jgi:hypothetical protein
MSLARPALTAAAIGFLAAASSAPVALASEAETSEALTGTAAEAAFDGLVGSLRGN